MRNKTVAQVLLILSPSLVLVALAMDIIIPCIPAIANYFHTSSAVAQLVLSLYFVGTGIGQIIIGPLADRFGRRKVILSSTLLFLVGSIICAFANSILMLIVARFFEGVGACGATVVSLAVIRDLFEDHTTPRAYSYVNSIVAMAPIFAPLLGGNMLEWFGTWRSCFYFVMLFGSLALIINYLFLAETSPKSHPRHKLSKKTILKNYQEILKNKEFLSFTYCAAFGLSGLLLFFSMSPILMINILEIAPGVYGYYFGFNFLVYLAGNMLSPKLQSKTSLVNVIQIGNVFILLGAALMLWWHLQFGLSILALMVPVVCLTFGVGLIYGPCMAGAMRPFKHLAGTASASYGAIIYCSSALIVAAIMLNKIENTMPFAIAMLIMGSMNILITYAMAKRSKA